ncbi:MAG: lamin tail domain-containing protein [Bacteroidota bacterium]
MKKLCLLFSLCPVFLWGQVKINFENGQPQGMVQFPVNRWAVNSNDPLEGTYSLEHAYDNSSGDVDAVSFSINEPRLDSLIKCSFVINYRYQPSGSNKWCFYFLSENDASMMTGPGHNRALMLGVNQTGTDDSLRVYYREGKRFFNILTCKLNCESDMAKEPWKFLISLSPEKGMSIQGGPYPGIMRFLGENKDFIVPDFFPSYIGMSYSYTASRDRLLKIDEIEFYSADLVDTISPAVLSTIAYRNNIAQIKFDENIYEHSIQPLSFNINYAIDSFWIDSESLFLKFQELPVNGSSVKFEIQGISDRKNNTATYSGEILWYYPFLHDVIFSEIMADPSPPVYLPEKEYLEIYNRTHHDLNLEGWKLYIGKKEFILPEIILSAASYHFFTSEGKYLLPEGAENYSEIFSASPAINNRKEDLILYTPDDILIDAVPFSDSWYDDDYKEEGGWSLERVDMENVCGRGEVWKASGSFEGGTPGKENHEQKTVHDFSPPFIRYAIYKNKSSFLLRFNESLDKNYFESQRAIFMKKTSFIDSLELLPPFYFECHLKFHETKGNVPLVLNKLWSDCKGNITLKKDSLFLGRPEKLRRFSIIISEVLFSPWPGCPEFIELYNNTGQILNLADLKISVTQLSEPGNGGDFISNEKILFFPNSFLVLSKEPEKIIPYYDVPDNFFYLEYPGLPSLSDKGAKISIYDRANTVIDEMVYSEEGHFPLLNDFSGVSLERIFLNNEPGISSEWHSASSLRGFATPGSLNSQNVNSTEKESEFYCEYELFTPDNDGYRDVALLNIKMEKEGYVAMIRIFDASGRLVKVLGNNELLGKEQTLSWDGRDESGIICSSGIYILHMEAFHLSGSKKVFKETVVLSR